MDRLVFGMHHLNISQVGTLIDGKPHYSHPNAALDLCGQDSGEDFFWNKEADTCFYCSGAFGTKATGNTRFFVSCDYQGKQKKVMCADGKERVVTLAMTHSGRDFRLYHIYEPNELMYSEGVQGKATGFHIHLEVAEGSVKTKYWDDKLKVYRMKGEMNPVNAFFILDGFTTVVNTQGLKFKHCDTTVVKQATDTGDTGDMSFKDFKAHKAETQKIIDAHCNDFTYPTAKDYLAKKGGYKAYVKSLGGVFTKYADFNGKVETFAELSEIGDYVWGLYDLWGVDYSNGCSYVFRENRYKAYDGAKSAYYPQEKPVGRFAVNYAAFSFANGNDLPTADAMFGDCAEGGKYYAVTNCGQGVVQMLKKAGLCPKDFPDPAEYPEYWRTHGYPYTLIKSTKDLRIGDVLYFFNKPLKNRATMEQLNNWHEGGFHTAIVGEMTTDGYVLYDSGHAYTYYGEFRNFRKFTDKPYQWAEDWIGIRFDFGLQGDFMTGWKAEGGKWYYYESGKKITGWKKIKWKNGTDWFYFDKNGVMQTGWKKLGWSKGTDWFYFTEDGAMVTGWQFLSWSGGTNWFYFNSDGVMQTGLQFVEWKGKKDWYLFDSNGAMQTGKQKAEIVLSGSGALTGGKKIG